MKYVIDASVIVTWVSRRDTALTAALRARLQRPRQDQPIAPLLAQSEVVNALNGARLRRDLSAREVAQALQQIAALPIVWHLGALSLPALGRWVLRGLSAYDATYVELAQCSGLKIATVDGPLMRNLRKRGLGGLLLTERELR